MILTIVIPHTDEGTSTLLFIKTNKWLDEMNKIIK